MTTWKETLKQEKAKHDQHLADLQHAREDADRVKLKEQAQEARKILEKALGIELPKSDVPTWELDGYRFSLLDPSFRYDPYTIYIEKDVPNATVSLFDDDDAPYGYRIKRNEHVDLPYIRGTFMDNGTKRIFDALEDASYFADFRIDLAETITRLDYAVTSQEETNAKIVKNYLESQSAPVAQPEPVAPKPRIEIMTAIYDPVLLNRCRLDVSDYVNEGWQIISTHYSQSSATSEGVSDTDYTLVFVLQRTVYDAPTPPEPEKVAVTPEYASVTAPIATETPIESPVGEEAPEEVLILNPVMTIVQPTSPELMKLTEKLPNARRILDVGIDAFLEEKNAEVADAVLARLAISQNSETYKALTTPRPLGGQQLPASIFSEN